MKYVLIIWVCSFIEGNPCKNPIFYPKLYNTWYECSVAAHQESIKILQRGGYAWANSYRVGTKYRCKVANTT